MITIRRARPDDAAAIGAVHVAAWRSAYPGILPAAYLANLSPARQAASYHRAIPAGGVHVAVTHDHQIVGFVTSGRARIANPPGAGEIETLYVLDDWRDRGLGRQLMRAAADHLVSLGCTSVFLWVLRENPSRWFYAHLGGVRTLDATISFAGQDVVQSAYLWSPIEKLLTACTTP